MHLQWNKYILCVFFVLFVYIDDFFISKTGFWFCHNNVLYVNNKSSNIAVIGGFADT